MKLFSMLALVFAFAMSAQAKTTKVPGTSVAKPTFSEPSYSTSSYGSSFSFAPTHEITTNFTGGQFISGKECKDCSSGTVLSLKGSYLHYWKDNMQWGVEGSFQNASKEFTQSGKSATRIDILGIGTYNLTSELKNAIYAKGGVGLYSVLKDDGSDYENKFGLFVGVGKRFAWLNNISYAPELRLVKRGDLDFAVDIEILNFSIYWN